jgi:hypothetical protein
MRQNSTIGEKAAGLRGTVVLSALGLSVLLYAEGRLGNAPFLLSLICALAFLGFLLTRRPFFSVQLASTIMLSLAGLSVLKQKASGFSLHAGDIPAAFHDGEVAALIWQTVPLQAVAWVGAILAMSAWLAHVCRTERARDIGILLRAAPLVAMGVFAIGTMPDEAADPLYYMSGHHASSFAVSFRDMSHSAETPPLVTRLHARASQRSYGEAPWCGAPAVQSDIVFLRARQQLPPSFVSAWSSGQEALSARFASDDGTVRRLGVEALGSAGDLTLLNLFGGISTAELGADRQGVVARMTGRIGMSLPQLLRACGYRTVALLRDDPARQQESFLRASGFETVSVSSRTDDDEVDGDARHLAAVGAFVEEHRAADERPLLLLTDAGDGEAPPGIDHADDEALDDEVLDYLAALETSRDAIDDFLSTLRSFADSERGTLLVEFGDRRPRIATDGVGAATGGLGWQADVFTTHYAIHRIGGLRSFALADHDRMDAAFLGFWLLDAAGIAGGGMVSDLARLSRQCDGLFHLCAERGQVDRMLQRRIESGLLDLPGWPGVSG